MMPLKKEHYPDYLNPFDSDEEIKSKPSKDQPNEYPDHLSPFGDEEAECKDEYDESLNPFGFEDGETNPFGAKDGQIEAKDVEAQVKDGLVEAKGCVEVQVKDVQVGVEAKCFEIEAKDDEVKNGEVDTKDNEIEAKDSSESDQKLSLEAPPIPLPRTKSLLKKELALKNKQSSQSGFGSSNNLSRQGSNESSCTSSSITGANLSAATNMPDRPPPPPQNPPNTVQRNKPKRNAPPVPINFKRQVCGSLEEIETELNKIGDSLQDVEKEFLACQHAVVSNYNANDTQFEEARVKLIDMIKKKSAIVRHQKELMYRKRELKLDQIHSDIEYELRMIGNKQLSNRTAEDDKREKELLTSLVEIVEEKSDIVENLNKDSACDKQDIEETFKRMNIDINCPNKADKLANSSKNEITDASTDGENCDKSTGSKFSKIATLLPKTGTIRGKMKIKRKRLFKKYNSHSLEH